MSKSFRHHKRRINKTQRRRKVRKSLTGGSEFDGNNLHEFKDLMNQPGGRHLFALHSDKKCGHCKQFEPEWNKVLDRLYPHPRMMVAKLGPHATDYMNKHHYGMHNHAVNGVPTIVYYIVNNKPQEYDGERTADKIIAWLEQKMAENNLELTFKHKTQPVEEPAPVEVPLEEPAPVEVPLEEPAPTDLTDSVAPPSGLATTESQSQQSQDAFPQEPLSPASTLSKATDAIKDTVASVDNKIEEGVSALTSAFTSDLDLFSSSSTDTNANPPVADAFPSVPEPAAAPPAAAPPAAAPPAAEPPATEPPAAEPPAAAPPAAAPPAVPVPPQNTPSVVGGVRRKCTRRRNRRHKKSKKSRK